MQVIFKLTGRIKRFFHQFYRLPYCVPAWGWEEHRAIIKCLVTGRLIKGPHIEKLYATVSEKTGSRYVFGFNSGREAIYAALKAWGIGPNDGVILPSYCCETVARAVTSSGATPIFCDIGDDYNPDYRHILSLIRPNVRAIIFPHLFGNPGAIDALEHALENRGLISDILLIDDAAQSFGARLHGRLIGTFGDAGIISFGPGKTMTASGGGLLITNSGHLAENLKKFPTMRVPFSEKLRGLIYWVFFRRWRKFTLPFFPLFKRLLRTAYPNKTIPAMLCNIDAAIAVEQFKKLDRFIETRVRRKQILDGFLTKYGSRIFCLIPKNESQNGTLNVATKYLARIKKPENIRKILNQYSSTIDGLRIELMPLYTPIHLSPEYSNRPISLSNTENYYNRILQIPLEPSIKERDFEKILSRLLFFAKSEFSG